jgi:hypothetical protein
MITDEMLSAFIDGEADEATTVAVESAVRADPAVAARLARLRSNDATLTSAVDRALGAMPERLHRALGDADGPAAVPRLQARRVRVGPWARTAAAATLAMTLGVAAGMRIPHREANSLVAFAPTGPEIRGGLSRALSTALSDEPTEGGGVTAKIVLSFRASDGRYCRQFETTSLGESGVGVACKDDSGWSLETLTRARANAAGGYRTAGAPDDPAIDDVLAKLGLAKVLDRAAEAAAIRNGWR